MTLCICLNFGVNDNTSTKFLNEIRRLYNAVLKFLSYEVFLGRLRSDLAQVGRKRNLAIYFTTYGIAVSAYRHYTQNGNFSVPNELFRFSSPIKCGLL